MPEISGFEFIALDRLRDSDDSLLYDPDIICALETKGLVTHDSGEWMLTNRGQRTVEHVIGH